MLSRSELPGNINRRKFLRALVRLGFEINERGGAGSHVKAVHPNQKMIVIPQDLRKDVLTYIVKEIERVTPVTWEDIRREL